MREISYFLVSKSLTTPFTPLICESGDPSVSTAEKKRLGAPKWFTKAILQVKTVKEENNFKSVRMHSRLPLDVSRDPVHHNLYNL